MNFDAVLKSCRDTLFNKSQFHHGGTDLTSPSLCNYLAFSNMYRIHHRWRALHSPFDKFVARTTNRILQNLGQTINVTLVRNDMDEIRVTSQQELIVALQSGYIYEPGKPHEMLNPCAEIPLGQTHMSSLMPMAVDHSYHIGGSPFTKHIVSGQLRLVMRHIYRYVRPAEFYTPILEGLPYVDLNQRAFRRLTRLGAPTMMNELFYSFYNQNRQPQWWHELRSLRTNLERPDSTEILAQFAAKCIWDAMPKGTSIVKNWRTSDVTALVEGIWQDEAFDRMPILADALQDAGCDNEELLSHLRDGQAEHTLGSWIFRCCGKLK